MDQLKSANAFLLGVSRAMSALKFYPQNHPALKKSLQENYAYFLKALNEGGGFTLTVHRGRFEVGGLNPDEKGQFTSLAEEFFLRGVSKVSVKDFVSVEDFVKFLKPLKMDPHQVLEKGGYAAVMGSTAGIIIEEMDFETRMEILEEKMEIERGEATGTITEATISMQDFDELEPQEELLTSEELKVKRLIEELKKTYDVAKAKAILKEILNRAKDIISTGEFKLLPYTFISFYHIFTDQKRPAEIRKFTAEVARALVDERVIAFLIKKSIELGAKQKEEFSEVFIMLGETTIKYLLEHLFSEETAKGRRIISHLIVKFGRKAIPHILSHLHRREWFIIRNCLYLLGEIGEKKCIQIISPFIKHPDERVEREAIIALSKIPHRESLTILLRALDEVKPQIKPLVIRGIGELKDESTELLLLHYAEDKDEEIKKEAIMGLAKMNSRHALNLARELLKKKNISKRLLETAFNTVEVLGTPQAVDTVETYLFSNDSDKSEKAAEVLHKIAEKWGI